MMGFAVDPIFTTTQAVWFAALLTLGVTAQFVFSPKRRALTKPSPRRSKLRWHWLTCGYWIISS